ncbi:MAG: hypothetical protein M3019_09010 [Candidatus Dormibacteraeota bacterium]|nr:hypothetical protein [Candidatus Dormibacteraeota bacterium]
MARWRRAVLTDRLAVRLHYLCLPVAFAGLLWYMRRQYFTEDDWEFIHRLIPGIGKLGLFAPHNEHWSTIPLLIYRALFATVGVRSYIPYLAVLLALHVLAAHLLWRIMVRAGADVLSATAIATVFLLLGTGAENIDWAFQVGFVGALAAGLGMIVVAEAGSRRRLPAAWLLGVAALMFSGLGPIMLVAAGLGVALKLSWRQAFLTTMVPGAVFIAWLLTTGRHTSPSALPHGALREVPNYVFTGITSAAATISGLRWVGALLLLPLAWWCAVQARRAPRAAAVVALAATTLLFFLAVGVGRVGLGVGESKTSRYVYIAAVLLLPAVAVAASQLGRRHVLAAVLVALLVGWAGIHNVRALVSAVNGITGVREHAEARIVAASHLVHNSLAVFPGQPEPATAPDLTWDDLMYLAAHGDLPATSLIPPSEFDIVSVAANLQMTLSPVPLLDVGPLEVKGAQAIGPTGCVQVTGVAAGAPSSVQLVFRGPASVSVHAPAGSVVTVHLFASPSSRIESPPHQATVDASGTVYLVVSLPGAAPLIDLPAGSLLCGSAAP